MKKLRERAPKDHSQSLRLGLQIAFIALNVWIAFRFLAWVRWIEGTGAEATRPAGIEGWLPIAGLMNLKSFLSTGVVPEVHPAAMVLLAAFLAISLLLKKAFCSWLCPIGTLSEMLWKLGRKLTKRDNVAVPKWVDLPLRSLKYLLFGFFAWTILGMPAEAIDEFMRAPYGVVADIKLLQFFRYVGTTAMIVIAVLIALSVAIKNFWCRYLCPYGALLGIASLVSPVAITRDANECIDCAKCAKACPSRLSVDVLPRVRSAECTLCMSCVAACPAKGALQVKAMRRSRVPAWAVATSIAMLFLGAVLAARATGHWQRHVPDESVRWYVRVLQR